MTMIQLALDASMVRQTTSGADEVTLTVTVAGCSLANDGKEQAAWTKEQVRDSLLPWHWPAPEFVMFYWIKNDNTPDKPIFLKLAINPGEGIEYLDPVRKNIESYRQYYDDIILDGLKDPDNIINNISLQDFVSKEEEALNIIDVKDDELGGIKTTVQTDTDTPTFTGFLPATIAQLAQRTPPVNWLLNLAYLAFPDKPADWVVPADTKGFVAFPVTQKPGSPWSIAVDAMLSSDKDALMFSLTYEPYPHPKIGLVELWPETDMTGFCLFTPLPSVDGQSNDTIILRDTQGNFQGEVQVQLSDVPDWLPALIKATSSYFHSCAFMQAYLANNWKMVVRPATAADIPVFTEQMAQAEDFLYATLRDVAGLGYRSASNMATIPEQLATRYCNQRFGMPETLSDTELQKYWKAYDGIINHPGEEDSPFVARCKTEDSTYKLATWKGRLAKLSETVPKKSIPMEQQTAIDNLALKQLPLSITEETEELKLADWWERVNIEVTRWLEAWRDFFKLTQDSNLLSRIVFAQLKDIFIQPEDTTLIALGFEWSETLEDTWISNWLLEACEQLADIQAVHQEGMAWSHSKQLLAHVAKDSGAEEKLIIADCVDVIREHQATRLLEDSDYFPHVLSPAPAGGLPGALPAPLTWQGFYDFSAVRIQTNDKPAKQDTPVATLLPPGLPAVLKTLRQKTTTTVLPLKIKIDSATVAAGEADDLSDELAGHLVLMVRSKQRNQPDFADTCWKHLNRTLVKTSLRGANPQTFSNSFITPLFVPPPMKGQPPLLLEVSNEKPCLLAGHNRYNEAVVTSLLAEGRMAQSSESTNPEQWFEEDPYPAYRADELWYGYYYRAAAFVALNSGVLPEPIAHSAALPNIPKLPKPQLPYTAIAEKQTALHHFLRRVPVSRVRVMPTAYKPLPESLYPLAYELKEWAGNADSHTSPAANNPLNASQTLYLLAPAIAARGAAPNFAQQTIWFELRKPASSYENWKAWMGEGIGKGIQDAAQQQDYENRTRKGNAGKSIKEFCDPAVENVFVLKAEPLFPKNGSADIKYKAKCLTIWFSDAETANLLDDPFKLFAVSFDDSNFDLTATGLTVPKGWVVRLSIHAAIPKTYYNSGNEQRFYDWMGEQPIAIEDYPLKSNIPGGQDIPCWLTYPTELWFEAAICPDDKTIVCPDDKNTADPKCADPSKPNKFVLQLWKALRVAQKTDGVTAFLDRNDSDTSRSLAYMSRAEVGHQVWNWNGRLDLSGDYFAAPDEYLLAANPEVKKEVREAALTKLQAKAPKEFGALTIEKLTTMAGSEALISYVWKNALNPVQANYEQSATITKAMEWEAWAFSDRPDFSALVHETRLLAYRDGDVQPTSDTPPLSLYTDRRPGEEKALYYRFAIRAYSRYERLGPAYTAATMGAVPVGEPAGTGTRQVLNPWCRYIRLATRTQVLPRPVIRFVIPLTRSIEECGEETAVGAASLLLVLDDRWFAEAGLAEQLEVGIDLLPGADKDQYLNAGPDPILTGEALNPIATPEAGTRYAIEHPEGQNSVLIFRPLGPIGLTFDFTAQTPLLRGSAFVISLPDLSGVVAPSNSLSDIPSTSKLGPWALLQIAVRRSLRPHFCNPEVKVTALTSRWTAREWVQIVPSTDALIPAAWRRQVARSKYISLTLNGELLTLSGESQTSLPAISNEELMQRYYILTELVNDIGGQPVERYVGTYRIEKLKDDSATTDGSAIFTKDNESMLVPSLQSGQLGYLRIMLVRKRPNHKDESPLWQGLFGEVAKGTTADFQSIQNDPTLAMPLVSERIPYRIC